MLPVDVVHAKSVKVFQKRLQGALMARAQMDNDFSDFFTDARRMTVSKFQSWFR